MNLLKLLWVIAFIAITAFLSSFILLDFWNWFVLPSFETLPRLTKTQVYGLCIFLNFFKRTPEDNDKDSNFFESMSKIFIQRLKWLVTVYSFGWAYSVISLLWS